MGAHCGLPAQPAKELSDFTVAGRDHSPPVLFVRTAPEKLFYFV